MTQRAFLPAFNSKSGVPFSDVNLRTHKAHAPKWGSDSSLAEVTTVQLEFEHLARLSGNQQFKRVAERSTKLSQEGQCTKIPHLLPIFINAESRAFEWARISLGARGDSYYEYLLKQWLLRKKDEKMRKRYHNAVEAIERHLVRRSKPNNYAFIAEKIVARRNLVNKMDHWFVSCLDYAGCNNGAHSENGKGAPDLKRLRLAGSLELVFDKEKHPTGLT